MVVRTADVDDVPGGTGNEGADDESVREMASASSRRTGASRVSMRMVPKGGSRMTVSPAVAGRTRSVAVKGPMGT